MAEKGFGVKEINLIGASGTPTIESPNNLNLNAVNVAISTNVSIGGTLSVTGNVSVGGTLTYEDVTSIDSVGLITARSGVVTPNVDVDDFITVGSNIQLGNAGVVTATTFSGSGASLTSIPAGQLTGTVADARISTLTASKLSGALPAISGANLTNLPADTPTNSDIQVAYTVTANGSSAYRFAGNGVVSTADDPDLYLIRGQKYRFINNSGGSHPFQIREASGGTAYSTGVTNNGASSGNIDFAPTFDSPAQLVYQCTSHSGMVGNIYLRDAAGGNTNVGVTTFSGLVHLNQLKKTSGTLDYLAATHTFANVAGSTEYFRFASSGQLGIAGANYGTSGQVLTSAGSGSAPTWATPSSGLSHAQQWHLTANADCTANTDNILPTNAGTWQKQSAAVGVSAGTLGSDMTYDGSGVFAFPVTGIWKIEFQGWWGIGASDSDHYLRSFIQTTVNNSSFSNVQVQANSLKSDSTYTYQGFNVSYLFDVTSTSNCKCRFVLNPSGSNTYYKASTSPPMTGALFMRLGDT